MRRVAATIVAKNRLADGRVVARSFRRHHPDIPFILLLADEPVEGSPAAAEPFEIMSWRELDLPDSHAFRMRYEQQSFSYACTPFLLNALLKRGYDRVLFFKQESLVLGPMQEAWDLLDSGSMMLTPHLVRPVEGPDGARHEQQILLSGVYNIGLVGVTPAQEVSSFLSWWERMVTTNCRHEVRQGLHFEQRWMDMAPSFVPELRFLRHPGYNVAHWNLCNRTLSQQGGNYLAEGHPCYLFRFSGFDWKHPDQPTRYFDHPTMREVGVAQALYQTYYQALMEEGVEQVSQLPYAFDTFADGIPIPAVARMLFSHAEQDGRSWEDPFAVEGNDTFRNWLQEPVSHGVTRFWHGVWQARPDVQAAYPDPLQQDAQRFRAWCYHSGLSEHRVPDVFWPGGQDGP